MYMSWVKTGVKCNPHVSCTITVSALEEFNWYRFIVVE